MPLPSDQVNSFLKLLDALSTLKNRNSRFIGPQFVHLPGECFGRSAKEQSGSEQIEAHTS